MSFELTSKTPLRIKRICRSIDSSCFPANTISVCRHMFVSLYRFDLVGDYMTWLDSFSRFRDEVDEYLRKRHRFTKLKHKPRKRKSKNS